MRIRSWREVQRSMHLNRIVSNSTTAIVIDFHYMIRSQTFYRFSSVTTAANTAQRKIRSRSTFNVHHHHQKQEMNRQKRKCVQKNANAKLHNHVDWASGARWKRAHIAKQINTSSTSLLFSEQFSHRMHCSMLPPSLSPNGINWIDQDRAWIRRRFAFIYLNVYATISLLCSPFTLSLTFHANWCLVSLPLSHLYSLSSYLPLLGHQTKEFPSLPLWAMPHEQQTTEKYPTNTFTLHHRHKNIQLYG